MDTVRRPPIFTIERALLAAAALAGVVFLHCRGTAAVADHWLSFLRNVDRTRLASGAPFRATDYPPVARVILLLARRVCALLHTDDFTSFKVCLLGFYGASVAVFRTCWKGFAPLALFIGTLLLSGILRGDFAVLCAPTLLLALWALRGRRHALFGVLYALTCFIRWEPAILAPFLLWVAVRPSAAGEGADAIPFQRPVVRQVWPDGVMILAAALVFGWPLFQALRAAFADPFLSDAALNANWVWTFALHWRNPATFGALVNGYQVMSAYPIAFSPLINGEVQPVPGGLLHGWVWLPRAVFAGVYATTLWRFVRGDRSFPDLLRAALLGYLAFGLFDTGVRGSQFFIAALLACVLASVDPRETARAILVTAAAALNLVIFDGFAGNGLGYPRVLGIDLTVPLALLCVAVFLWWWVSWLRTGGRMHPALRADATGPLAPGGPCENVAEGARTA